MSCKHSRTYAVDTHDRIDCLDCDASWEGQDIVKLEANLAIAVEALEEVARGLKISEWFAESGTVSERILVTPGTEKARDALEKIRGEK